MQSAQQSYTPCPECLTEIEDSLLKKMENECPYCFNTDFSEVAMSIPLYHKKAHCIDCGKLLSLGGRNYEKFERLNRIESLRIMEDIEKTDVSLDEISVTGYAARLPQLYPEVAMKYNHTDSTEMIFCEEHAPKADTLEAVISAITFTVESLFKF